MKTSPIPVPLSSEDALRFVVKMRPTDTGCWEWMASKNERGYGQFNIHNRCYLAHRVLYAASKGGRLFGVLDHLCRNHACVNPAHLEEVTQRENLLRGNGFVGINARKTHCPQGHPYDAENTWHRSPGGRTCRICHRARHHLWRIACREQGRRPS